jgi:hypothetical protein
MVSVAVSRNSKLCSFARVDRVITREPTMTSLPALQIRHSESSAGDTWVVRATWQDGAFEEISGFQSEAEADGWITAKFPIWVEEISKARAG